MAPPKRRTTKKIHRLRMIRALIESDLSTQDIADYLGVSRQRAAELCHEAGYRWEKILVRTTPDLRRLQAELRRSGNRIAPRYRMGKLVDVSKIGRRGGLSRSERKINAARQNLIAARAKRWLNITTKPKQQAASNQ